MSEERRCLTCGAFHHEWRCPYPAYPKLGAGVEKHRRKANDAGGVMMLEREARRSYGNAVSAAIRAKQRVELRAVCKLAPLSPLKHQPPSIKRLDEVLYKLAMKAKRA